jgi:ABC-2 type transport system permease protein
VSRSILSRARLAGLGLLGLAALALGIGVRLSRPSDPAGADWQLVASYGLAVLVPVVALVFASAALGDLAEDGTLVYLWLRPVARWKLALAALASSAGASLLLGVLPLVVGAALAGAPGRIIAAAAAGGSLAVLAYSAVFCGLGLRVRRALAWGLAYLLIWEQAVAHVSHGAARASIYVSTTSLAAFIGDRAGPRNAVEWSTGLGFALAVAGAAWAVTTWILDRGEVP